MKIRTMAGILSLFAALAAQGASKGLLVLQIGSDWCESGNDVRKVFESSAFRSPFRMNYDFAIYDDMETPTPKVAAQNKELAKSRVETRRFPAITCLTPRARRFFAQLENIPADIEPKALAAQVTAAIKAKDEAEALFKKGSVMRSNSALAASWIGRGFEILTEQVGEFNKTHVRKGDLAYSKEWEMLAKLDAGGRYGWVRRFEMGYGFDLVAKATKFRTDGAYAKGAEYIASLRKIPTNHLAVVQRQCFDMAEYALWRKSDEKAESNKALLRHAFSLGRDTVWGQCAMGYLILDGEEIERRKRYHAPVKSRPAADASASPEMKLSVIEKRLAKITPDANLTEKQKTSIALYAVLRRIGEEGWDALRERPGARKFMDSFFLDRVWMEDFAWSGPCNGAKAILALESLVFQDGGRWLKGGDDTGRRWVTAAALELPGKDEDWLADYLDAYRETALSKRLHRSALSQPVWLWRFAIQQSHGAAHSDDPPNQQRFIQKFVNTPFSKYDRGHWNVPYRMFNCFGESVHTPAYYMPWVAANEWALRSYSYIVGGVCGELSKFGSSCANSHGLPSMTVGQPNHCAYTRRRPDGSWQICNCVGRPTDIHLTLFPGRRYWTYLQAHEGTFEGDRERRHDADRFLELAVLAENLEAGAAQIEAFYKRACKAWPTHYGVRCAYSDWLARAKRPLAEHRAFARECTQALRGWRQPLWDLLSAYFARVGKENGDQALTDAIAEFAPLLRQPEDKIQEEGDLQATLTKWTKPLEDSPALLEKAALVSLNAQRGTRDFFAQVLGGYGDFLLGDPERVKRFIAVVGVGKGNVTTDLNLGPLILAASRGGNLAAFRQMTALQDKIAPPKFSGKQYPRTEFGGTLISAEGMVRLSTSGGGDKPARYARALDASPCDKDPLLHTDEEESPWMLVTLAGLSVVKGVVVENRSGDAKVREQQVPIEIQLSEDGQEWQTVFTDTTARETYRADLRKNDAPSLYVRVRRRPNAQKSVFRLAKILVYGKKLY